MPYAIIKIYVSQYEQDQYEVHKEFASKAKAETYYRKHRKLQLPYGNGWTNSHFFTIAHLKNGKALDKDGKELHWSMWP